MVATVMVLCALSITIAVFVILDLGRNRTAECSECPAPQCATRSPKQTGLSHRVFEITEGVPNSAPEAAQKWEADFRAKEGVALFYPRAVNEMRMLAKAVNQAKSDDPKAIAPQLEGMTTEGFDGGEITMRKDDHQLFQDMFIGSFGPLDPADQIRRGRHRLGLEDGRRRQGERHPPADDLQDGAALTRERAGASDAPVVAEALKRRAPKFFRGRLLCCSSSPSRR